MRALLVVQPSVSHYRAPMLRCLLADGRVDWSLAGKFDAPEGDRDHREAVHVAPTDISALVSPLKAKRIFGPITWETGLLRQALSRRFDVVILEGRIFTLSTWLILILRYILRRRTLLWGHGWRSPDSGLKGYARLWFYRLADGLLIYGNRARSIGLAAGYPRDRMFVVGNSIYPRSRLGVPRSREASESGEKTRLICVSRLSSRRRLDLLVRGSAELAEHGFGVEVHLVGDGAARVQLEELAAELSAPVTFHGPLYEYEELAEMYARMDLCVIPGAAGLGIAQALGFGVPVIIHDGNDQHGPESELVIDGVNGAIFSRDEVSSLTAAVTRLSGWQSRNPEIADRCIDTVKANYCAEAHAAAIVDAVLTFGSQRKIGC